MGVVLPLLFMKILIVSGRVFLSLIKYKTKIAIVLILLSFVSGYGLQYTYNFYYDTNAKMSKVLENKQNEFGGEFVFKSKKGILKIIEVLKKEKICYFSIMDFDDAGDLFKSIYVNDDVATEDQKTNMYKGDYIEKGRVLSQKELDNGERKICLPSAFELLYELNDYYIIKGKKYKIIGFLDNEYRLPFEAIVDSKFKVTQIDAYLSEYVTQEDVDVINKKIKPYVKKGRLWVPNREKKRTVEELNSIKNMQGVFFWLIAIIMFFNLLMGIFIIYDAIKYKMSVYSLCGNKKYKERFIFFLQSIYFFIIGLIISIIVFYSSDDLLVLFNVNNEIRNIEAIKSIGLIFLAFIIVTSLFTYITSIIFQFYYSKKESGVL